MPAVLTNGAQQLSGQWAVGSLEVTAASKTETKITKCIEGKRKEVI